MGLRLFTVLLVLLYAVPFPVVSAPARGVQPAFLTVEAEASMNWTGPVSVRFQPDEALCREKYGKNWETGCRAALGRYNALEQGVRIQPAVEGTWRWSDPTTLWLQPVRPLSPETTYTVNLEGLPLPGAVVLDNLKPRFTTLPLAANIDDDHLWIDPSSRAAHGISCTVRFTWPVEPEAMNRRISVVAVDPNSGLRLAKPELVWNQTQDEVTLYARIEHLPEQPTPLEVRVTGLPRWVFENGDIRILAESTAPAKTVKESAKDRKIASTKTTGVTKTAQQDAVYRFTVQGVNKLFSVTNMALKTGHDTGLGQEYRLELDTSLHTRPADIIKAIKVIRLPRTNTPEAATPYAWDRAPRLAPEDLERGAPLRLEALQPENEPAGKLRFRVRGLDAAGAGRYLFIWLPAGFTSVSGLPLTEPYQRVFNAEPLKAELDFLQPGSVLTLGGERKLDIHSSGLTSIRWEVSQIRSPFLALLAQDEDSFSEPLGRYGKEKFESLGEVARGELRLAGTSGIPGATALGGASGTAPADVSPDPGTPQFSVLDLAPLLKGKSGAKAEGEMPIRGLMQVTLFGMVGDKNVVGEYDRPLSTNRFLLVTDLGMMVKKGVSGVREVFISSLSTGDPVSGVDVRILGANGMPVVEARTNAEGRATLPSVSGLEREKRPVALVASRELRGENTDLAWMPLNDNALKVDTSAFPTAGRSSTSRQVLNEWGAEGVNAYVFGQRGMFRPGETVHFGMIVRRNDWTALPADLPLEAVLVNPAGAVVLTRTFTVGGDGMSSLSWNAPETAMTGRYRLDVRVGDNDNGVVLGTGAVRLEEFQPDTLAIEARILPEAPVGWLVSEADPANVKSDSAQASTPDSATSGDKTAETTSPAMRTDLRADISLRNLYGMPATDRRIRATMEVAPAILAFPGYADYTFHDAAPYRGEAVQETLPEARTDNQGKVTLALPLSRLQSGTVRCTLLVEGFEPGGGRAVSVQRDVVVSPLRTVLGYQTTGSGTNLDFIPQGRDTALKFVALNSRLEPVNTEPLTFVVSARRYVSSLVTDAAGRYRYDALPVDTEISRTTGHITPPVSPETSGAMPAGASSETSAIANNRWKIPTEQPGEYLLTVRDADNRIMASVPFTVAGESLRLTDPDVLKSDADAVEEAERSGNADRAGVQLGSGKLRLRIDKADYDAGDTINLFLSAPYDGSGLVTIERDGVFAHRWFRAKAGDSVHSIVIPSDFEGQGYVNVSLVRGLNSPDIYMEPHTSAIVPFTASIRKRDMGLVLKAPEQVRPGDTVSVTLTSRYPGKALIFAVDEGVLQLTTFQTPSPLTYFLRDRALEVETMQVFDLLMPDHAQLMGRLPGFGGDMASRGGRFLNPFKRRGEAPLAFWSELVDVNPQGTVVHFTAPGYYNGKVRVMAVGSSGAADVAATIGNAETATLVRGSLVLTPQLPSVVVPGDTFEGFLAVANNGVPGTSPSTSFALQLDTGPAFTLVGDIPTRLEVAAGAELVLPFRLKTNDKPGATEIRFHLSGTDGSDTHVTREAAISVRPATHNLGTQLSGSTTTTRRIETGRNLYAFRAEGSASVSALPLPALRGLVRYLDAYPHGCVEQLLSRAFPYVVLSGRSDLLIDPRRDEQGVRKQSDELIAAALSALQAGFRHGHGVSLWPGGEPDDLLTVYAGDFLLALRESGRGVSSLDGDLFYVIEEIVGRSPASLETARIKAYGIWVLTREGRVTSQAIEQLVTWLNEHVKDWKTDVTSSFLAGSCAIMRQDSLARQLMDSYSFDLKKFRQVGFLDSLAVESLHAAVLARHFPGDLAGPTSVATKLLDNTLSALRQGRTTFSAAQGVRALMELSTVPTHSDSVASPALDKLRLVCVDGGSPDVSISEAFLSGDLLLFDAPGCSVYELQVPDGNTTPWYWQVSTSGFDRVPPENVSSQGLEINRVYRDVVTGAPVTAVNIGDEIRVDVRVQATGDSLGREGVLENVAIVDLLPGGFEMVIPRTREAEQPVSGLVRMERREDRMIFFVNPGTEPLVCSYLIRAVNRGRFTLPSVQAEAMYIPSISAHSAAGVVEVN